MKRISNSFFATCNQQAEIASEEFEHILRAPDPKSGIRGSESTMEISISTFVPAHTFASVSQPSSSTDVFSHKREKSAHVEQNCGRER